MACFQLSPRGDALATLQKHLPRGEFWHAYRIIGKTAYKLFNAYADAYEDMSEALCRLVSELNPYSTEQLITEWERSVGLPDACLPAATTLQERRDQVIFRLTKRRWSTEQDWHDLAALFGLTITIIQGWRVQEPALFDMCFDSWFFDFPRLGRFYVYIDVIEGCGDTTGFDYSFDYPFSTLGSGCDLFKCILERVKPANVVILWNRDPVGSGWLTCGEDA